jgi:hypothetical protein
MMKTSFMPALIKVLPTLHAEVVKEIVNKIKIILDVFNLKFNF